MTAEVNLDGQIAVPAETRAAGTVYPWLVVAFMTVLYTSSYLDRTVLGLLVKPIRAYFGISDTKFSLLTGFAFVVFYSFAGIPLGRVADRWSRRGLIVAGVAFWSLMTAGCGLATSYWRLFAMRVGVGVGEATLSPCAYSLTADYFPPQKLSRALALYAVGIPIGSGLALLIGGWVVKAVTEAGQVDLPILGMMQAWQLVFLVIGLPGLLLALLARFIIHEPRGHKAPVAVADHPTFGEVLEYLWRNRAVYRAICLGMGVGAMVAYGANAWYPAFLQRVYGYSIAESGQFLGASTIGFGVAGCFFGGWLADRLSARGRTDGHLLVGMYYCAGLAVCVGLGPIIPIRWLSLALIALTGFFTNTWVGVNAAAIQLVTPQRMRGQVSAIYLFIAVLISIGGGPFMVAFATDHIFGRDDAVGWSLVLNAAIFPTIGILFLNSGRAPMRRLRQKLAENTL